MIRKLFFFLIIIDVLYILKVVRTHSSALDTPVIFLILLINFYKKNRIFQFLKTHFFLVIIISLSFIVRFLGTFYPEHYGLVEQEIYTLPIVAVNSGEWMETFKEFTSFETLGLVIQASFFYVSTYFDFNWLTGYFHFLFPEQFYFLNIPSFEAQNWPAWSSDGTYEKLTQSEINRYAVNQFSIRWVSAIFGTMTIGLVYLIGKKLYNQKVALFSACVLGFTFIHVVMSMTGRLYIISTLFLTLYFLGCTLALKNGKSRDYLLSAVALGLTNAVKVFPAGIFPILTVWLIGFINSFKYQGVQWRVIFSRIISILIISLTTLLTFIAFSWGLFSYPEHYLDRLRSVYNVLSSPTGWGFNYFASNVGQVNWLWWLKFLSGSGLYYPLFLTTFLGLFICLYRIFIKKKKEDILLLSGIFPYFVLLNQSATRREEFITFITPFLAICSGIAISLIVDLILDVKKYTERFKKNLVWAFLFFVIGIPALRIFLFDYSLHTEDNRTKAAHWIKNNINPGDYIYTVGTYNRRLILEHKDYFLLGEDDLRQDLNFYAATGVDYFLTPAVRDLGQFVYHPSEYQRIINYLGLLYYGQLEAEFYRPFFKQEFFSEIITSGDLINEHFDNPLQIYKFKRDLFGMQPSFKIDSKFLAHPPEKIYYHNEGFSQVGDPLNQNEKVLISDKKGARLSLMPVFGKGKYQIIYRLKVKSNLLSEPVTALCLERQLVLDNCQANYIKGSDFQASSTYQDFTYEVSHDQTSYIFLDLQILVSSEISLSSITVRKVE